MTTRRLLDSDEALRRLETQLGPLHAQLRLGMEREHEAQAFGQGLSFLHLENLPLMQAMIEITLRVTGTYWRGRANAGKVQVRRNIVRLPNLPSAFDGFTVLHLSDLHADLSGPAMRRAAELAHGLEYDLCVLTGDYRGPTHGDCRPCLEGVSRLREALRGDIYAVLGNHNSITMVPDLEALGIRMLLTTSASPSTVARLRSISRGSMTRISTARTTSKRRRRTFHAVVFLSCYRTLRKSTGRPRTPVSI